MSVRNGVWYDVDLDQPAEAGTYLVATEKGGVLIGHWYPPRMVNGFETGGRFGVGRGHVTHWMPLPKPPAARRKGQV